MGVPVATLHPRFVAERLRMALTDSPVVLLHGPRQSGKTTLARLVGGASGYAYFSFDDELTYSAAGDDPIGFVADLPYRAIIDEVQRVPAIFRALKVAVDRDRKPGRFILTGSANALLVPGFADAFVGRVEIVRLHPLAQSELAGREPKFLDALMAGKFELRPFGRLGAELAERVAAGGYPAALTRPSTSRRATWYRDYVTTQVQRDVLALAQISALDALPALIELAAGQTGRLLNVSELAAPFELSRITVRDYVALLELVFLLDRLPAWHSNRLTRLVKRPKLHIGDTGLACALLKLDAQALLRDRSTLGQLVETFVYQELRRQASWRDEALSFYHFRDSHGAEVDVVIERGAREVAGVEVKASGTVTAADFRGLRKLRDAAAGRFAGGVLLYDGENSVPFGGGLYAVPIRALWELA